MTIRVGTCGYSYYDPPEGWRDRYESKLQAFADAFDLVELNRTFYDLPQVATAERWRREVDGVNEDFEFAVKAWQALTHPTSSPTWRDTDDLTDDQREAFGYCRPEAPVVAAWDRTREIAEALGADVVLLQTPPSFDATEAHEANLRELVDRVDRGDLTVAWEPRGDWLDQPERTAALCDALDLVFVDDPLRRRPRSTGDRAYCRLHGLNEAPYDYDYAYAAEELDELAAILSDATDDHERVYCLFNTFEMYADAPRLADRLV